MLMTKERRPATQTLRGWAISVLREAGAIHECEEHAWMKDRTDPHARECALDIARRDPPSNISPEKAVIAIAEVLDCMGDTLPGVRLSGLLRLRREAVLALFVDEVQKSCCRPSVA
ncbi:hypothetical protein [Bradyrhizobium sp. S3.2.12]|uniref:hypothetical protein n=1 Tax=Bradyrhizobium sp. S3.2.12 TaxID=3156387 RepID=UPI003396077E